MNASISNGSGSPDSGKPDIPVQSDLLGPLDKIAQATQSPIVDLPSKFMIDPQTYKTGGELGFSGMDFYVAGRGGALGDVAAGVVTAAFFFFNPELIAETWSRSAPVMPRNQAAEEFARCAHRWAEDHLPDSPSYERINWLLSRIAAPVNPAGAPLFAGWMTLSEPQSPKALAIHRLNGLRELRGAYHIASIMAQDVLPREAVAIKTSFMLGIYGWGETEITEDLPNDSWQRAEASTNRLMGRVFEVLDDTERGELVDLLNEISE